MLHCARLQGRVEFRSESFHKEKILEILYGNNITVCAVFFLFSMLKFPIEHDVAATCDDLEKFGISFTSKKATGILGNTCRDGVLGEERLEPKQNQVVGFNTPDVVGS